MSDKRAATTYESMQTAAAATGNGTPLDMNGYNVALFHVTGTFSATITWEATIDGTNWAAWPATNSSGAAATTTTATGLYRMDVFAASAVRARISIYGSGSVTVVGRGTA